MSSNRSKVTTAPALVHGVIDTINNKRNGSIISLQDKMETTSRWLDEAITVSLLFCSVLCGLLLSSVRRSASSSFRVPQCQISFYRERIFAVFLSHLPSFLPQSAKRKIVEGTGVSIQDVKKAKTTSFKPVDAPFLSPIRDKENSPNGSHANPQQQ